MPDAGRYITSTDATAVCVAESPILVPAGTAITDILVYFYDNSTSCDVTASLVRRNITGGSAVTMATFTSAAVASSVQSTSLGLLTLGASSAYAISVSVPYATSNGCRIYGYKLSY